MREKSIWESQILRGKEAQGKAVHQNLVIKAPAKTNVLGPNPMIKREKDRQDQRVLENQTERHINLHRDLRVIPEKLIKSQKAKIRNQLSFRRVQGPKPKTI